MNTPKLVSILATALSIVAAFPTHAEAASDAETIARITTKTPPSAPFLALLSAAKLSDVAGMKNAYSQRIREESARSDWNENLRDAQTSLRKLFGDYQLAQFGFTFSGNTDKGTLSISHNGKQGAALKVVKEGNQWKLDER